MLDKTFSPAELEARIYAEAEQAGLFAAGPVGGPSPDAPAPDAVASPYAIVMPPPNVTGTLHMGHALNMTLQDILVRYQRARGRDVLWQPGTDHAGIATQMVVERQLQGEGRSRQDLGREAFLKRVWEWKAESGNMITSQLRRLGASPDWSRERFTLDDGVSRAVRRVFVELHAQGLIYRDKRLVNWDPKLKTAISDLEVEQREVKGSLWYIAYPLADGSGEIVVATTRPETMLGDTAIAVNAEDPRYQALIGRQVMVPLADRSIPIVADDYSDPEKGSGAVKITPAHDFNDFEVGRRHDLPFINIFDAEARLTDAVPEPYRGLSREAARTKVVADLEAAGRLVKIEPIVHMVPYGDRSGVVIEPWLTDQWYCDAKTLAQKPIEAVESGRTKFVPRQWESTFFEWMRNIQPWCISRQLWWGHQIPAWYGPDGTIFVAEEEPAAQAQADAHYGQATALARDPDVLDTWFSSALWPFSTLGWPDPTPELARYYPTSVLVTGFDIIFFWVARMMMMGCHFMGEVPFDTVYIHALVRDERGQKMSKSKGNIIDPLVLIDKYGADALRFTMAALAAPGRDVKLAEKRVEGYRNFATKLWNAARYVESKEASLPAGFDPAGVTGRLNRWIIGEIAGLEQRVAQALEDFRFDEAASALYQFTWASYCDWYLELTKPILTNPDADQAAETRATTAWVLHQILRLLSPIMPFITQALYGAMGGQGLLAGHVWPALPALTPDPAAEAEISSVIRVVGALRAARADFGVVAGKPITVTVDSIDPAGRAALEAHHASILRLVPLAALNFADQAGGGDVPAGSVQIIADRAVLLLDLVDAIDIEAERKRLGREVGQLEKELAKLDAKLANPDFLAKAEAAVIEETRERRAESFATRERLAGALARLG